METRKLKDHSWSSNIQMIGLVERENRQTREQEITEIILKYFPELKYMSFHIEKPAKVPKHIGQKWIRNKAYLCEVSEHKGQRKEPLRLQREKKWVTCEKPYRNQEDFEFFNSNIGS